MNNTMVREIRGAKMNPKSSFKNQGAQNTRGRKLREQVWYIRRYDIRYSNTKRLLGTRIRFIMQTCGSRIQHACSLLGDTGLEYLPLPGNSECFILVFPHGLIIFAMKCYIAHRYLAALYW